MKFTRSQIFFSLSWPFHAGIGPRPLAIFQAKSPSGCCPAMTVKSAGLGLSAAPAGPSPRALAPWQLAQFAANIFLPRVREALLAFTGLGRFAASSGAIQ